MNRAWSLAPALAIAALAAPSAQAATGFALFPAALAFSAGSAAQLPCSRIVPAAGPLAPAALSKASSILGGAPSQMELILRQQSDASGAAAPAPALAPSQPARAFSFGLGCTSAPTPATPALVLVPPAQPFASPFRSGPPLAPGDFLSSHRLPISHTAFDAQWARVSHAVLPGKTLRQLGLAGEGEALSARLAAVNAWTNRQIRYTEDAQQYATADYWADPRQTLKRGAGDCEDIAILKMQLLAAAGVPRSAMFLTIARDLARHADHALLVVRDGERYWLLDNATDALVDASTAQDYRPIFSFGESGKWLHGY